MKYKVATAALAASASFGVLAQGSTLGSSEMRLAMLLQERAEKCQPALDGNSSRRELTNGRLAALAVVVPAPLTYAIASAGLTACFNTNLRDVKLEDGRPVLAVIHFADRSISLAPRPVPGLSALEMAGKGVVEAIEQIRRRGGPHVPAHMLQPLAVVPDPQSVDGFTLVPNDPNVLKAAGPSVLRPAAAP